MNSNPYNAEDRFDQDAMDDHEAPQVHLWDYVQIVLQRLPLVLCVLLASMVLAAVYTWTRTPRFTASARLLVQPGQIDLTDMKGAYDPVSAGLNQRDFMQTQVKLITSQPVIATVLEKANLISDPQFSESSDPIRELTAQISVEPLRNTYLIDISTERQSARQSQRIVNELMDAFMAQDQKRRMGISEKGLQELEAKAESLRGKLDAASQKLRDFMVDNKMVSLEKTQNVIIDRLRDISRHLTAAEPVRMAMEARVEAANQAMEKGQTVDSLPDVMKSPVVKDLKLEMAKLEREYSQLLQRLGENHPQLQAISTQIESLQTKLGLEASSILAALNNEYEQARKEEELLRQALAKHEEEVLRFNELGSRYNLLKQTSTSIENTYQTIIRRIEEIDINRIGGQGNNIFVISRAALPTEASWPHKGKNMVVALFLSSILAIGMCFFLDYMDTTIKGEAAVRSLLGCNVLAGIPDTGSDSAGQQQSDLIIHESPRSHAAEAFRTLRTALAFSTHGGTPKSIVVSSAFPEEGKSLVSINLAIAQAKVGRKTLIVDTDMRKPRLHNALSVSSKKGIANLLANGKNAKLDDLVVATSFKNLYFLPCGPIPPNPAEMLDSSAFEKIVREIESKFDFAVFDAPPCFSLVDALIMGKQTKGLLLVIRSFVTPKRPLQQLLSRIHDGRIPLIGTVLNNVDLPKSGYYYGSYYYGRGGYYYAHPDTAGSPATGWQQMLRMFSRKPPPTDD